MIRTTLLLMFVAFFSAYAWKNWFVSLCSAILLLAVVQHPDFPNAIGGIQGANPWNFLILCVTLAWTGQRGNAAWDLPMAAGLLLISALVVIMIGVVRLLANDYPSGFTTSYTISECFVNTVKWVIPGLLLFDACRTRRRIAIALGVTTALYFLLALQVIRWMPLSELGGGGDLASRASKITQNEIGYNRVTLSMMLSGASWAALGSIPMLKQTTHRFLVLGVAGVIAFGQALTGGRTGYLTWIAVGMALAALRWRKLLLVMPVVLLGVGVLVPGARERMFQGFAGTEGNFTVGASSYEMTSGRDVAWPVVIGEIGKAPWIGHGREAMVTTGIKDELWYNYGEAFPHPHQAYLQLLLDNGIIGTLLILPFFLYALRHSVSLVLSKHDPLVTAVGCAAFCLLLALMVGGFGGQTFYPREGAVGMWAAIGLMLRTHANLRHAALTGAPVFPDQLPTQWFIPGENDPPDGDDSAWLPPSPSPTRSP